jgi:hypothetical protein
MRRLAGALLAAALSLAAGRPCLPAETLDVPGKITSVLARDADGDGLDELWVSYHAAGQRFIGLFRGVPRYSRSPDAVVPLDPQAILFSLGDHDPAPGLELVLISRSSGVLYPLDPAERARGFRKLFATDLFFSMPGLAEAPPWLGREKIDIDSNGADDFVLPEKRRLRILLGPAPAPAAGGAPAPAAPSWKEVSLPVSYYILTDSKEERIRLAVEDFLEEDKTPAPYLEATGAFPFPVIADFDGDGLRDVIVRQRGWRLEVFRQRAPGDFPAEPHLSAEIPWAEDAVSLELADIDGDRKLDLVATRLLLKDLATEVRVFIQDPAAAGHGFSEARQAIRVRGLFRRPVIADADRDGRPDLLVSTYRLDLLDQLKKSAVEEIEMTHEVFRGASETPFERRPSYQERFVIKVREIEGQDEPAPFLHAGRDLTGDARPDILFIDAGRSLRLFRALEGTGIRYEEDRAFEVRTEIPLGVQIADLDNRGGAEVILRHARRLEVHRPDRRAR